LLASVSGLRNLDTSSDSVQQSAAAAEVRVSEFLGWISAIVIICHILKLNCRAIAAATDLRFCAGVSFACITHSLTFTVNAVGALD